MAKANEMRILVVDVGGNNLKLLATGQQEAVKVHSGPTMTPRDMTEAIRRATANWPHDVVSIGYPGPVRDGRIQLEPRNLGLGWVDYDFAKELGKPVRIINDAAMQALGSYEGGRMLFLGLGTGLGSALIVDKTIAPLELAHLPYRKGRSFEDYVGQRGLVRRGKKKWQLAVEDVVARLQAAMQADSVVLGGGNVKKLTRMPPGVRLGDNRNAFLGGFRLWTDYPA